MKNTGKYFTGNYVEKINRHIKIRIQVHLKVVRKRGTYVLVKLILEM